MNRKLKLNFGTKNSHSTTSLGPLKVPRGTSRKCLVQDVRGSWFGTSLGRQIGTFSGLSTRIFRGRSRDLCRTSWKPIFVTWVICQSRREDLVFILQSAWALINLEYFYRFVKVTEDLQKTFRSYFFFCSNIFWENECGLKSTNLSIVANIYFLTMMFFI